jgi:hypothetical protein
MPAVAGLTGEVVVSVYSSGPSGRLVPGDVAGLVRYVRADTCRRDWSRSGQATGLSPQRFPERGSTARGIGGDCLLDAAAGSPDGSLFERQQFDGLDVWITCQQVA